MGVRLPKEEALPPGRVVLVKPLVGSALGVATLILLLLIANGRPIGAGDTRATERVAASLVQEGDFDLDESPEVEPPFAIHVGEHSVSIYPVLAAVMATPVFAACRTVFALDETGSALAGKLAAALFGSVAAGVLFLAMAVRGRGSAAFCAFVFALGTSLCSTSQALWQHPAAVMFLCLALLGIVLADHDEVWAGRAGLPLGLMVAARHADVAIGAVLALAVALRWRRRLPYLVLWGLPGAVFVALYNWAYFGSALRWGFSGSLPRFSEPWGLGHLGLLVSPAKGLLVFTPVALLAATGLVRAYRKGERWLAGSLGAAALGHWLLMGRWKEWHGGECWGPRLLTDLLPLLFLFLPEGFQVLPRLGRMLTALSVGVQALGALAYDYRWERLYQRAEGSYSGSSRQLWSVRKSPIVFTLERRVIVLAAPAIRDGSAAVREHPVVLLGPQGSRVEFRDEDPVVSGADATFGDVHLQRSARVDAERLKLQGRWAALFLRVAPEARVRHLELRIAGEGRGPLYVGERSFWSTKTRWTTHLASGAFLVRHPYFYPESGGGDLIVTVGRGGGEALLQWVALVPPGDPLKPVRLPE